MSALNLNETSHAHRASLNDKRADCISVRPYFNSHYAAKPEEQGAILDLALSLQPNDVIVELGVCNGQTAAMLARSCAFTGALYYGVDAFLIECIDPNDTSIKRTGIAQLQYLVERMDDLNLNGQLLFGKTQEIGKLWTTKRDAIASHLEIPGSIFADNGIALLFIDAGHDEANIKPDIDIWLPLLAPGGVVIFHDYDNPYDPSSPHEAVRRNADAATDGWERDIHYSMMITRKPIELKSSLPYTHHEPTHDDDAPIGIDRTHINGNGI